MLGLCLPEITPEFYSIPEIDKGPLGPLGPLGAEQVLEVLFLADKDPKFGLDFANGVSESIWDPINPVPKTLLFRYLKRRAHHLSPDPNILKPKTPKLKFCHFQDSGQSPLQALLGPLGPYVAPEARFWPQTRVSGSGVPRRGVFFPPRKSHFGSRSPLGPAWVASGRRGGIGPLQGLPVVPSLGVVWPRPVLPARSSDNMPASSSKNTGCGGAEGAA